MLSHQNPHIRCLILVYLRLVIPPAQLLDWFEDMLNDHEELVLTDKPNLRHTKVSEVASNLLLEMKYLDTRFPRIAETHMRKIRTTLANKGFDAGTSDVGQVARDRGAERPGGRRDDRGDERATAKKRCGRLDLDDMPDTRKRPVRPEDDKEDRPRKRSNRPDLDDGPPQYPKREIESRADRDRRDERSRTARDREAEARRPREREERDRGRRPEPDQHRQREQHRDEQHRDERGRDRDLEGRGRPDSPGPEDKKGKPDQLATALAKLRNVYGDLSSAAAGASEGDLKGSTMRKNYLGSEKLTLGGRAWGQ